MRRPGPGLCNGYMTNTATAHATLPSQDIAALAAVLGGVALVVDTVTITVVNSSFGVLDDVFFYTGLGAFLVTLAALAAHFSRRVSGVRRIAVGALVFLALLICSAAFSLLMDAMGQHVFSDANVGLHGEWSFFSVGVVLLLFAGWSFRRH